MSNDDGVLQAIRTPPLAAPGGLIRTRIREAGPEVRFSLGPAERADRRHQLAVFRDALKEPLSIAAGSTARLSHEE
jgi:hypothetical protein